MRRRLRDESLSHSPIEIYLMCPNRTVIGWGEFKPFSVCPSLLRINTFPIYPICSLSASSLCSYFVVVVVHLGVGGGVYFGRRAKHDESLNIKFEP